MLPGHSQDFSRGTHNFLNISFKIQSTNESRRFSGNLHNFSCKKKRMHVSELNNWRKNVLLQMFAFFLFPF